MKHLAIQKVVERAEQARSDSDFAYFFSLLLAAESLAKTIVAGTVASLDDDQDRNRYRLEHSLIRKDGLGDWGSAIEDSVSGTASQFFSANAQTNRTELNKQCKQGEWQYEATAALKESLNRLNIESEDLPIKTDLKRWFRLFITLRNKTRGHGATTPSQASDTTEYIEKSLNIIIENLSLFRQSWVYLYRNLSGKYRVSKISGNCQEFNHLKSHNDENLENGIYIFIGEPRRVRLMESNSDLQDFYYPNGGFKKNSYELLSYITDDKVDGDASPFQIPPGQLPPSETEGHGDLLVRDRCLSNAPDKRSDYISRRGLESELRKLLLDERHPIITLLGPGGIGKTSLAIKVIHELFNMDRYASIVWLSARDVDLQSDGPKAVRRAMLTVDDMVKFYSDIMLSKQEVQDKKFDPHKYFEDQMRNYYDPCLFVFDNFETVQNPIDAYNYIETHIRQPNKALITTRLREFKGDYPVEVKGMHQSEAEELIDQTAIFLCVSNIITDNYKRTLIADSDGHPYVLKILLGEVAKQKHEVNPRQFIARTGNILTALFERTYAALTPCAQRAFLTLSGWNSPVPWLALESVLIHSTQEQYEVKHGIELLLQFSIAEIYKNSADNQFSGYDQNFIFLPMVAREFGRKKLNTNVDKTIIDVDIQCIRMFGPINLSDPSLDLFKLLNQFIANMSREKANDRNYRRHIQILELICQTYNPGRRILAKLHLEKQTQDGYACAINELKNFLENDPPLDEASEAWRMLAHTYSRLGNALEEVHALVKRAQIGKISFFDLSNTANILNRVFKDQGQDIEKEQRHGLAEQLATVLRKRKSEANGTDLSRMAWLELHRGQEAYAREYVRDGLVESPDNFYLQKLASHLNLQIPQHPSKSPGSST